MYKETIYKLLSPEINEEDREMVRSLTEEEAAALKQAIELEVKKIFYGHGDISIIKISKHTKRIHFEIECTSRLKSSLYLES